MKILLSILATTLCITISAQNISNPYSSIGKKAPKMATLTDGEYEEFFQKDSLVQIGTTIMNRYSGEVVFFAETNPEKFEQFRKHNEKNFRFLSVDPSSSKYAWQSPYSAMGNNPILIVDPTGGDNIVYLVVLPSTYASLTKAQVSDIIKQANQNYKNMGLKTEVRLADPENFDIGKIDKTDAVAVLGDKKSVTNYVATKLDKTFGEELKTDWDGGSENPEHSENNRAGSEDNVIAIDASGLAGFANKVGLSDEENSVVKAGALSITHGSGHNSGLLHSYSETGTGTSDIMRNANDMKSYLSAEGNTNETLTKREVNKEFKAGIRARFGNNKASETNKQSVGVPR